MAHQPVIPAANVYNPPELYAVLALNCGWLPRQIDQEHYITLFAVVREIGKIKEKESDSYKQAQEPLPDLQNMLR